MNEKCKIQGQVTKLQMPFIHNRKSFKNPSNFSSAYLRKRRYAPSIAKSFRSKTKCSYGDLHPPNDVFIFRTSS